MDTLDGFFSDDASGEGHPPPLVRVVSNPRLPADGGLIILGLLMQTAGSVLALFAATYTVVALLPGGFPITIALLAGLSAARSAVHARVGKSLVEQGPRAADGLGTYALVAGLHTAVCLVLALVSLPGEPPLGLILVGALALMSWPLLLLILTRRGDVKRVIEAAGEHDFKVVGEDRGLTALGILMVVGGVLVMVGCLAGAVTLLISGALQLGFFAIIALVLAGLFGTRAWFGFKAGRIAMTTRDPQRFMALFDRYNTIAFISIALTTVIVVIFSLFAGLQGLIGILTALPVLFAGLAWPRAIRGWAQHNLPETSFGDPLPAIRRPRDAGLTGLGLVLLATGLPALIITLAIPALGPSALLELVEGQELSDWTVLVGSLVAFVAGWSLFAMVERFQPIAVLYGLIAGGLGIWSVIGSMSELLEIIDFAGPQLIILAILQGVLALALPTAVLWQALRHEEVGEDAVDADLARAFD